MENKYCEQCIIDRDKEKCDCKINGGESCPDCYYTYPKEEITANAKEISSGLVNDWESEFDKKWVKMFEESSWPMIGIELKQFISNLISSTEKRMAKEICEILKDKQNLVCSCATKECPRLGVIINLIKSKYE